MIRAKRLEWKPSTTGGKECADFMCPTGMYAIGQNRKAGTWWVYAKHAMIPYFKDGLPSIDAAKAACQAHADALAREIAEVGQ